MLNSATYNESVYNWATAFIAGASNDDIIFNWLWMQNANIVTSFKNDDNLPTIELTRFQNPVIDGGWLLARRYTNKQITLRWTIKASTGEELNNLIDVLKQKTSATEWFLDIKINWIYRRTKATVVSNNLFERKHFNISYVPFEITFETLDPFFYNREDATLTDTWITWNHSTEFAYFWSAPSQPRVYLIFTTATWTDEMIFTLNWKKLTVSRDMNDGDILLFDSITKTVKVNWTEIDYAWSFPIIQYGDNLFDFQINGTPLLDITILYATNFL